MAFISSKKVLILGAFCAFTAMTFAPVSVTAGNPSGSNHADVGQTNHQNKPPGQGNRSHRLFARASFVPVNKPNQKDNTTVNKPNQKDHTTVNKPNQKDHTTVNKPNQKDNTAVKRIGKC
ncbi:hypothetical protein BJ085DRAFT_34923 [Dimargaris cristalligena]|uniref:Uncharacterized protein n=1 Tax=Dimargaris cristalligena TaxID=215637 RepID=A0A4P9ZMU5_9FUNG|nr:hypothetical protein BJ085DRAFT_34923 [Dimargaris cristalligena]|eukprot:RKP34408.1 hypothetical protein BJ085DRAFT_34923 [Dimargaris cristalligena]